MPNFNYLHMTDILLWTEVLKLVLVGFALGMLVGVVIASISDLFEIVIGCEEE